MVSILILLGSGCFLGGVACGVLLADLAIAHAGKQQDTLEDFFDDTL